MDRTIALISVFVAIVSVPVLMYMMYRPEQDFWIRRLKTITAWRQALGSFCSRSPV